MGSVLTYRRRSMCSRIRNNLVRTKSFSSHWASLQGHVERHNHNFVNAFGAPCQLSTNISSRACHKQRRSHLYLLIILVSSHYHKESIASSPARESKRRAAGRAFSLSLIFPHSRTPRDYQSSTAGQLRQRSHREKTEDQGTKMVKLVC